jgi:branched-chain amino acid transport system ATP-binding protein
MPALSCDGLSAGYDDVAVVRDLDLTVDAGEVVALCGPNGAGKTTLLLTLSGLLRPLKGSVRFFGEDIAGVAPERLARMGMGHVPDDRCLFTGLSTLDNLKVATRPGGLTVDEAFALFPTLAARSRLAASQLSGGEQQMLVLCRALANSPRVLMVDEMSMGLAPAIIQTLLPVLKEVADRRHVAVLMVEQHVHLALSIADRAYVMSHGRMVLTGSARDLSSDPDLLHRAYLGEVAAPAQR